MTIRSFQMTGFLTLGLLAMAGLSFAAEPMAGIGQREVYRDSPAVTAALPVSGAQQDAVPNGQELQQASPAMTEQLMAHLHMNLFANLHMLHANLHMLHANLHSNLHMNLHANLHMNLHSYLRQ